MPIMTRVAGRRINPGKLGRINRLIHINKRSQVVRKGLDIAAGMGFLPISVTLPIGSNILINSF